MDCSWRAFFSRWLPMFFGLAALCPAVARAAEPAPLDLYQELRSFALGPDVVRVENLAFKRDRVQMTFTGEFYLAAPVGGRVYSAVFLGEGRLHVDAWSEFEKDNLRRLLKSEAVDATFTSAVLRFTDDTIGQLKAAAAPAPGAARDRAAKLAAELEDRLRRETGLNVSARLAQAIFNRDEPGVFFGQFDGGKPSRFSFLLDYQARAIDAVFGVDGGEKGILFQYRGLDEGNDIWTAFYSQDDFARRSVAYSDTFALVSIPQYRMDIDVRDPGNWLRMDIELDLIALRDAVQLVPMRLNEGLAEFDQERLKKGLRVRSAALADGTSVGVIQEDWETGFSLALPQPLARDQKTTVRLHLEGRDTLWTWESKFNYLRSTTTWYPRHEDLERSAFTLRFRHRKKDRVVSVGERTREGPAPDNAEEWITEWVMREPVALVTFAVGPFERRTETTEVAGRKIPVELYSVPPEYAPVKEDFVLAELMNGVQYFSALYGNYPYARLGAAYFPANFGQGFPTLLLLPVEGFAHTHEFAFIAHEGAHQWWGNIVAWRSYRDQWLSEGFAEYSGAIYTGMREKNNKRELELFDEMREALKNPPRTEVGVGAGKLNDVGPLILGHRLSTRKTHGAYFTLIYDKGALVLRMLDFLLSNPATGDDAAFFAMMKDFVARHQNGWASTESFMAVASEHFARSPVARKYGLQDLNWFLRQWVYQTGMPSYRLEYQIEPQAGGGVRLTGTLYQEGVPDGWFMVLPVVIEFSGNRSARGTVAVLGASSPVSIPLPEAPTGVRLDPYRWVISEKTSEKKIK